MRGFSLLGPLLILCFLSAVAQGSTISPLICSNPGSTTASQADLTVNANSCTDYSYLVPNSQATPTNNWLYGYYQGNLNPTGFSNMTQQIPVGSFGWWAVDFVHMWTSLDAFGGHPNSINTDLHQSPYCDSALGGSPGNCGIGPDTNPAHSQDFVEQWAVRRYVVPIGFNGLVTITLSVQKDYRTTGSRADGNVNYIIRYSGGVATQIGSVAVPTDPSTLNTTSADPSTFPVQTVTFQVAVQGGDFLDFAIAPNSNDFSDGEFQFITIEAVPEPSTLLLVGGGLLLAGFATRRKFARRA